MQKKEKINYLETDPYANREADKYLNPVPSREYISEQILLGAKPLGFKDIINLFSLDKDIYGEAISRRLKAMVRDGQLETLPRGRYWLTKYRRFYTGIVKADKNNMWLEPELGQKILLARGQDEGLVPGDKVYVSVPDINFINNELDGKLEKVIEQSNLLVLGRLVQDADINWLSPLSQSFSCDILIPHKRLNKAKHNDLVLVKLLPTNRRSTLVGKVVKVMGNNDTKGIETKISILKHDIPHEWPDSVLKQVDKISSKLTIGSKRGRVDLRQLPLVTIDGEDTRDFDDAVYCKPNTAGGFTLYVAIADVSYYVKEESAIDKEALLRGTSVYFPKSVIPMLPEVLSNNLCSLVPGEDRLSFVCEMQINNAGKMLNYKFYEAIICSHARLTYNQVTGILSGDNKLHKQFVDLLENIEDLAGLYAVLNSARVERQAVDFDIQETKFVFDKNNKIKGIKVIERTISHRIIEECMLCANVASAKFLLKHKALGLFRNHPPPSPEKFEELRKFLIDLGVAYVVKKNGELDYFSVLNSVKDRQDFDIIQMVLLRSLSQACYAPDNVGHFGLAYQAYAHFTSPIRRYPDLLVHRQIKAIIDGEQLNNTKDFSHIGEHCSFTERRADESSREVLQLLKCKYMQKYIGATFVGMISGITRFGFFVTLNEILIDGLVHVSSLCDDYYIYDGIKHHLIGERTAKCYQLGMTVMVRVACVNVDDAKIDLELLVDKQKDSKSKKSKKNRKLKNQKK